LKIADGFDKACDIAVKKLESIQEEINISKNDHDYLKKCAMTALGSKVVSKCQAHLLILLLSLSSMLRTLKEKMLTLI